MNPEDNSIIVISRLFPPVDGETTHHTIFYHKDGRKVRYVRGAMKDSTEVQKLVAKRGNVAGTMGSAEWFEAFPDEPICQKCIKSTSHENYDAQGNCTSYYGGASYRDFRLLLCPTHYQEERDRIQSIADRELQQLESRQEACGPKETSIKQ